MSQLVKWSAQLLLRASRHTSLCYHHTSCTTRHLSVKIPTPNHQLVSRSIATTSAMLLRRRRGDDDENKDDDDDDDAPMSVAHGMRREQQQRVHRELTQKRGPRLAHYDESSGKGMEDDEDEMFSVDPINLYKDMRRMDAGTLLEIVEENHEKLEPVHFALALRRLNQLRRQEKDMTQREQFVQEVTQDEAFQMICAYLAKYGSEYDADVLVDMLIFLQRFHMDSDHISVKVMLELLKHTVSNIALDQMIDVAATASSMSPTGQTRLLLSAMELLVNNRVDELETLDAEACVTMLHLFGKSLKPNTMNALIKQLKENTDDIRVKSVPKVLNALEKLEVQDVDELYQECLDLILGASDKYTLQELNDVLALVIRQKLFCPELVECVGERARESDVIHDKISAARLFHQQEYAQLELLLQLVKWLSMDEAKEMVDSGEIELADLRDVLHCWADAHFMLGKLVVSQAVNNIMGIMATHVDAFLPDDLLDVCVYSHALHQAIPAAITQQLFSEKCVGAISDNCSMEDIPADSISRTDLLLSIHGSHGNPEDEPLPYIEALKQRSSSRSSIADDIENVIGAQHIMYDRKTSTGLSVGMQVELDPDENLFYRKEHYKIPDDMDLDFVQKVAVLPLRGEYFSLLNGQLKSEAVVYARALQKHNYHVSVINLDSFKKVLVSSKYNYIKDKVRGAGKYQDLLMMGKDNLAVPGQGEE